MENNAYSLSVEKAPTSEDLKFIWDRLAAYNLLYAPPDEHQPLAVFLRDSEGNLAGGLLGGTYWGWLHIEVLWLREDMRRQGYGQQLVAAAETEALRRGCRHAHVDTLDFQAPAFYEKLGYQRWGTLEDLPPGHTRIFFKKDLV